MQELVNTIRNTGATNIIMLGGVHYANALSRWLTYKPSDPQNNLAAAWHSYNFNVCSTQTCWNSTVKPVAQRVPVITGEIGENDCAHGYIDGLMSYLDGLGASYLGWAWDTWNCSSGPALISNYNGTSTNFGVGLQEHLAVLASSTPTATATPVPPATSTPLPTTTPIHADFRLSVSPSTQSVPSSGGTRSYAVTIAPSNGFQGTVTLSLSGQPPGSTTSFSPNPTTSASTLTVTVASRTRRGPFTLTVTGNAGTLSHAASVTLCVAKR